MKSNTKLPLIYISLWMMFLVNAGLLIYNLQNDNGIAAVFSLLGIATCLCGILQGLD